MDPDYRNPYTKQWNLGYSFQLNSYSVLEFDYMHVLALHESKTLNINPTRRLFLDASGNEITSRPLSAAFAAAGLPVLGRIDLEASVGRARYDGMNISYRRRLHRSLRAKRRQLFATAPGQTLRLQSGAGIELSEFANIRARCEHVVSGGEDNTFQSVSLSNADKVFFNSSIV